MLNKPPPTATAGERSFFNRVKQTFSDEKKVIGYFEPDVGGLHPDFLLLSPDFGVIVAEIKDYSPIGLSSVPKSGSWEKLEVDKTISLDNPFDQLHQYWRAVQDRVNFSHFPSDVEIPIIRVAVFSQISGEGELAEELRRIAPNKVQLCFKEAVSRNKNFQQFLSDILPVNYSLEKKHFQTLRANLIPSCRLPTRGQTDMLKYFTPEERIKLLDYEQERFAYKMGEGHRLIFGVAGSGKTVVLIARARCLAKKHPNWRILVLCFNKLLKNSIFHLLNPQDYDADITISNFHSWVRKYVLSAENKFSQLYKEAEKKAKRVGKMNEFFQEFVPKIFLEMLKSLGEEKVLYDAILIDEAQDFEEDWFRGILEVLNPDTNSLLITCDGLQGIYARKRFYWKEVGIQAVGRVKRFQKSYRIPIEIGVIAQKSLPITLQDLLDNYDEFMSTKEYLGLHGTVEILVSNSRDEEYKKLAEKVSRLLKQPQEILVLFLFNMTKINYNHPFFDQLKKLNVQWKDLKNYNYETPELLIGTIHGTKGLECDTIIIPEVNTFSSEKERQLLYVAITRTRKKLILSAHKSTKLIKSFQESQNLYTDSTDGT